MPNHPNHPFGAAKRLQMGSLLSLASLKDLYVHTNYFANGEIWSNVWSTWTGTGKTTGKEYSSRIHFDYKWENGKIVVVQGYFDESSEKMEIAAYTEAQNQN